MKILKKADLYLLAVLLAAAALAAVLSALPRKNAGTARLDYGNEETVRLSLEEDGVYDFESNGLTVHIEVSAGTAAFVRSECPDHICEHYGKLSRSGGTAVCLPAKAVLTIE